MFLQEQQLESACLPQLSHYGHNNQKKNKKITIKTIYRNRHFDYLG